MARYAISDIHGCKRTFLKALRTVDFTKQDVLVLLGDYIDRGLDSAGVISEIIKMQKEGYKIIPLMGNHEKFLIECYNELDKDFTFSNVANSMFYSWMSNGGSITLNSYGHLDSGYVKENWRNFIPLDHLEFYENLGLIFEEWDDYVFCHAGLDFSISDPLNNTSEDCILWSRTGYVDSTAIGGRTLITGHTPKTKEQIITAIENCKNTGRIIIDRGCVYPQSDYGHLAVMNLDTKYINFIKNIDIIEKDGM